MTDLVTPDMVEDQIIDLLERRHPEHLAKLERQLDLAPQTIERLKTIDVLAGEGFRLREDTPPAVLLGLFSTTKEPTREQDENGSTFLTFSWTLAMQIIAVGQNRRDTTKRRSWYVMTIIECLLQRLPRQGNPISALALADVDLINGVSEDRQRTVGEARVIFDIDIAGGVYLTGGLPVDNTPYVPGSPGGAPATPYAVPEPDATVLGPPDVDLDITT